MDHISGLQCYTLARYGPRVCKSHIFPSDEFPRHFLAGAPQESQDRGELHEAARGRSHPGGVPMSDSARRQDERMMNVRGSATLLYQVMPRRLISDVLPDYVRGRKEIHTYLPCLMLMYHGWNQRGIFPQNKSCGLFCCLLKKS